MFLSHWDAGGGRSETVPVFLTRFDPLLTLYVGGWLVRMVVNVMMRMGATLEILDGVVEA